MRGLCRTGQWVSGARHGGGVAGEIPAGLAGVMGRTVFAALADPVNTGSVSAAEARPKAWAGRGEA